MKILLTAINAKYIHSNLGIYSLKAYGEKILREQFGDSNREELSDRMVQIELAEYTINQPIGQILQDIFLLYLEYCLCETTFGGCEEGSPGCADLDGWSGGFL